jgi:hypothetical protein
MTTNFRRSALAVFIASAALAGCATRVVEIREPFDATLTAERLKPGPNTITGSALVRRRNGNIVTCAGSEVRLIPATPYANERIRAMYGPRHFLRFEQMRVKVNPNPPEYTTLTRATTCNASGFFRFESLGDGEYIVHAVVSWDGGSLYPEGGAMIGRATVKGGQAAEIVLAP